MSTTGSPAGKFVWPHIDEAHARLRDWDKQERRHWLVASIIIVALAITILALAFPDVAESLFKNRHFAAALQSLMLLVMIFAVLAFRRQRSRAKTRRELTSELAIVAASETLKMVVGTPHQLEEERRRATRVSCDQRLTVTAQGPEGVQESYGRIMDVCEHGIGAILPGSLTIGQEVVLQFSLFDCGQGEQEKTERAMKLAATVRQRTGFRYGFNFLSISDSERALIEALRLADTELLNNTGKSATASQS
jgi:hypothetical protein